MKIFVQRRKNKYSNKFCSQIEAKPFWFFKRFLICVSEQGGIGQNCVWVWGKRMRERERECVCVCVCVCESLQKSILLFSDTKSNQLENNPTVSCHIQWQRKKGKMERKREREREREVKEERKNGKKERNFTTIYKNYARINVQWGDLKGLFRLTIFYFFKKFTSV